MSVDPDAEGRAESPRPSEPQPAEADGGPEGLDAVPGLARIAASAWWHTSGWAIGTSWNVSRRLLRVATDPLRAPGLAREVSEATRRAVGEVTRLGDDGSQDPDAPAGGAGTGRSGDARANDIAVPSARAVPSAVADGDTLRAGGAELLRRSRDVSHEVDAHPAYERILSELAPDEARVLRLLMLSGPQPSVDIRTGGPVGLVRSQLVAPGLSMIGARAGCRYPERIPSYLNNLFRLGLVWFSRETIRDHLRYQVLEAQPDVLEAIHSVPHAKVVRRSIHLTPFGEDFCRTCLAESGAQRDLMPQHSAPRAATKTAQPPNPQAGD